MKILHSLGAFFLSAAAALTRRIGFLLLFLGVGLLIVQPCAGDLVFVNTGSLGAARQNHTATLLPNGKILVAGGNNANFMASAELYDPASGNWSATGNPAVARQNHTATLLPNGKTLVAGGLN